MTRHMGSNSRLLLKITDHVVEYAEAYWHRRPNDRLYSQASASQEQALAWYKDLCVSPMMLWIYIHIENIYKNKQVYSWYSGGTVDIYQNNHLIHLNPETVHDTLSDIQTAPRHTHPLTIDQGNT